MLFYKKKFYEYNDKIHLFLTIRLLRDRTMPKSITSQSFQGIPRAVEAVLAAERISKDVLDYNITQKVIATTLSSKNLKLSLKEDFILPNSVPLNIKPTINEI